MSLSKPSLNALALERSALELWHEWLGLWFDGASHAVGGHDPVTFPKAEFLFQQALPPHPMESGSKATPLAIHVVWVVPGKMYRCFDHDPGSGTRQEVASQRGQFQFLVRCSQNTGASGNADAQCLLASDRLNGVLNNSHATKPLAEKGLHRIASTSPVVLSNDASKDYAVRALTVTCRMRYTILSQV